MKFVTFFNNLLRIIPLIVFLFIDLSVHSQTIIDIKFLPKKINETSGLEYLNGNFITHNDSGGKERLYEFSKNGKIISEHYINDCGKNNDWEDITADSDNIYIANTGNNFGNRNNLDILIVDKKNNFNCKGKIKIKYKNQTNFVKRSRHPYDSEGIISIDNNLVLFSKNRSSLTTELYIIPKKSGNYTIESKAFYNAKALITGADYNKENNLVALVGYSFQGEQFIYTINNFFIDDLVEAEFKRFKLPIEKAQIEAIKIIDKDTFWLTSEDEGNGFPRLFKIKI